MRECSECGKGVDDCRGWEVDSLFLCQRCLFGEVKPIEVFPIGVVEKDEENISRIILHQGQKRFMYKIEEEQYLSIIYFLHKVDSVKSRFHRRLDGKEVSVFASRTPRRTSRIAVQDVELVRVENNTLLVRGLDAEEGSPVLDIKLYWSAMNKK